LDEFCLVLLQFLSSRLLRGKRQRGCRSPKDYRL